jgi:hypothetical protein
LDCVRALARSGGADPAAGNITIDSKVLGIDGSRIRANAPAGFGGRVTIVADNILVPGGDFGALLARRYQRHRRRSDPRRHDRRQRARGRPV